MLTAPKVRLAFRSGTPIRHPSQDSSSAMPALPPPIAMVRSSFWALPVAAACTTSLLPKNKLTRISHPHGRIISLCRLGNCGIWR